MTIRFQIPRWGKILKTTGEPNGRQRPFTRNPERVELFIELIFNPFRVVGSMVHFPVGFTHGYLDSVLSGLFLTLLLYGLYSLLKYRIA